MPHRLLKYDKKAYGRGIMKIDGVFSGGGVKAYAFLGALQSLEEHNLELERVAGTSAGAIIASFVAAGYGYADIKRLLDQLNLKQFADPPALSKIIPFSKWLFLYFQMGLYKGNVLENWLYHQLAAKRVYTFNDIRPEYLKVVVSDLSLGKLIVLPDDLKRIYGMDPKRFPVATAIRMSAGFPYFFMPKRLPGKKFRKSIIVDGGLLSNFPLWIFEKDGNKDERPLLGIKLSELVEMKEQKINHAFDMFHALFSTMKQAHDARYISKTEKENIIFIPVNKIGATELNVSKQMRQQLIDAGYVYANRFLSHWPK